MIEAEELRARVESIFWYHTIDLGNGITTKGASENNVTLSELPDFSGRSVLDIGAWDGYYSFLAERRGARRVVAMDHYAWCLDFGARQAYWEECRRNGSLPDLDRDLSDFWRPDAPGRRGFDLAHEALGSRVEPVMADFMTADLTAPPCTGPFDVVLFLGVLYHLKEPLSALERLRRITNEVLVIETEAVHLDGYDHANLMLLCPGDEFGNDYTNWYITTETALHGLCRAAGFGRVETRRSHGFEPVRRKFKVPGLVPTTRAYRLVVHAFP